MLKFADTFPLHPRLIASFLSVLLSAVLFFLYCHKRHRIICLEKCKMTFLAKKINHRFYRKNAEIENLDLERAYLEDAIPAAQKELTQLREEVVLKQNTLQNVQNAVLSNEKHLNGLQNKIDKKIVEIKNLSRQEGEYKRRIAQLAEDIPKLPAFIRTWGNKLNRATREILSDIVSRDSANEESASTDKFPSFEEFRKEQKEAKQQYQDFYQKPKTTKSRGGRSR